MRTAIGALMMHLSPSVAVTSELDDVDALVRLYRPRLLRYVAFSIGDPDLAETITQDCFLKAYNSRASFRGDCSVNTWLFSIANNLIRDQLRTRKFRFWRKARATAIDISELHAVLPSLERSPETQALLREQALRVQGCLDQLSPNQRKVFLLKFSEEMEIDEISTALGMPANTVKTHLHRAVVKIRKQLGGPR